MYLYFMFVNPLSHDPWRDSILIGLLSVSICILGSPENLHVPQQQYNTSGPILLKLKVMFFSINILNMILLKLDFQFEFLWSYISKISLC